VRSTFTASKPNAIPRSGASSPTKTSKRRIGMFCDERVNRKRKTAGVPLAWGAASRIFPESN